MYDENNKLESLTPEQEARFPEFVKFGLDIGLSTDRTDRVAGEKAIRAHYVACGLPEPNEIMWFDSPLAAAMAYTNKTIDDVNNEATTEVWAKARNEVWEKVNSEVSQEVRTKVWNEVRNKLISDVWLKVRREVISDVWTRVRNEIITKASQKVSNDVWIRVKTKIWSHRGTSNDADYVAYMLAYTQYGLCLPEEFTIFLEVNKHICWYYTTDNIVYASDRPTKIKTDDDGNLHCEDGKAIEFADGFGVSAWHGQTIPNEWVTGKLPTPSEALNWSNMDQRSVACELIGWANLREYCNSKIIDTDSDPMWGELVEMDLPDSPGERFLFVVCGTGRSFALLVPKETQTVDEAQSVLHGGLPIALLKNCIERT